MMNSILFRDLMGWTYSELMDWVSENVDRISELYEEVYGDKRCL